MSTPTSTAHMSGIVPHALWAVRDYSSDSDSDVEPCTSVIDRVGQHPPLTLADLDVSGLDDPAPFPNINLATVFDEEPIDQELVVDMQPYNPNTDPLMLLGSEFDEEYEDDDYPDEYDDNRAEAVFDYEGETDPEAETEADDYFNANAMLAERGEYVVDKQEW